MSESAPITSAGGCFLRLIWSLVLPAFALVLGASLLLARSGLGALDAAYGLVVALAVGARALDRKAGREEGVVSARRYALAVGGAAVVVYGLVRLVLPRLLGWGSAE